MKSSYEMRREYEKVSNPDLQREVQELVLRARTTAISYEESFRRREAIKAVIENRG